MPSAPEAELAELVKGALVGLGFAQAERDYVPLMDLSAITSLRLIVTPKAIDIEEASQRDVQEAIQVDVGIFEKLEKGDTSSFQKDRVDALLLICHQIAAHFQKNKLLGDYAWQRTTRNPIYDRKLMQEQRLFAGLVTLHFVVFI